MSVTMLFGGLCASTTLHLDRRQSWCVSTDPEFSRRASEIVDLYLKPPENAIVLSVDEKPSIQALERAQGYIRLPNGRAVRALPTNTKGMARRRCSRRSKPPLDWLRPATINGGDAGSFWIS